MGKLRQAWDVLKCAGPPRTVSCLPAEALVQPVVLTPRLRIPLAWGMACTCCPGAEGPWTHSPGAEWPRAHVRPGSRRLTHRLTRRLVPCFLGTTQQGTLGAHLPELRQHRRHRGCQARAGPCRPATWGRTPAQLSPSSPRCLSGSDGPTSPHSGGLCRSARRALGLACRAAPSFHDVCCSSGKDGARSRLRKTGVGGS